MQAAHCEGVDWLQRLPAQRGPVSVLCAARGVDGRATCSHYPKASARRRCVHQTDESTRRGCIQHRVLQVSGKLCKDRKATSCQEVFAEVTWSSAAPGVKRAVVSNFDTRLRPLLAGLRLDSLFDAIVVSAEVDAEKPVRCLPLRPALVCPFPELHNLAHLQARFQVGMDGSPTIPYCLSQHSLLQHEGSSVDVAAPLQNPIIFEVACKALGVQPSEAVHVGDDRRWGSILTQAQKAALACLPFRPVLRLFVPQSNL